MIKKNLSLIVLTVFILLPLALAAHFWITDPRGVMRAIYPLQASVSSIGLRCSAGSPAWLESVAKLGVWELKALSTQVAFINDAGEMFHCESGWQNDFLSERVEQDSRFRYGSLTKPITSAAVHYLLKNTGLSPDMDVVSYFSGLESRDEGGGAGEATLDEFMRHISGIRGEVFVGKGKPWCPYSMSQAENFVINDELKGEFRYSNLGYCILGEVIAKEMGGDYRTSIDQIFGLSARGISFVDSGDGAGLVDRDYRFNDFHGESIPENFDHYAISSTAGMVGNASSYATLMRDILSESYEGFVDERVTECDPGLIRSCYGRAFYAYQSAVGSVVYVKEGYMPGSAGVVMINSKNEVLVWLGNSDTDNAASGQAMQAFLDRVMEIGF
ncbi:serine hydrolase domain-containing protein [Marinobacter zhejiangensis]|uniref:serine hydrolase domain-containing protein n=1 Tax=Marinobacter zhejiangensis TaxID=488535 RepID=UPI0011135064|nr:serine hydrolase domain-containing protein [Marinobacter zhejiangensis]